MTISGSPKKACRLASILKTLREWIHNILPTKCEKIEHDDYNVALNIVHENLQITFNSQTFDSTPPLQIQDGSSPSLPSQKDIPKQL